MKRNHARKLNCSEVYGNRRPLDGSIDADLIKLYDKTGFEQSKDSDMIRYKLQYKNRKACEIPYAFFFLQKNKKNLQKYTTHFQNSRILNVYKKNNKKRRQKYEYNTA